MNGQQPSPLLHQFARLTAWATFFLIIAGALVVGHDAGLAVPDWPLSYGTLFPRMEGNIFYEHGHRMIAGLVATLTIILSVWLWRAEQRKWVRYLGLIAVFAVILQAVLGGITVLYFLPVPVLIGHATLAQTFFCLTISLAIVTGPEWNSRPHSTQDSGFPGFRNLATATTAAVYIQLILGAARRHHALGILPHMAWAAVVSLLVLWMGFTAVSAFRSSEKTIRNLSIFAVIILFAQIVLGFGSYFTRLASDRAPQPENPMIWVTTAHVAVGALLLGTSLAIALLAHRRLTDPGKMLPLSQSPQKTLA